MSWVQQRMLPGRRRRRGADEMLNPIYHRRVETTQCCPPRGAESGEGRGRANLRRRERSRKRRKRETTGAEGESATGVLLPSGRVRAEAAAGVIFPFLASLSKLSGIDDDLEFGVHL